MGTVTTTGQQDSLEVEVTAEFCFDQAAKTLLGQPWGGSDSRSELAREWRQLGESIAALGQAILRAREQTSRDF